MTTMHMEEEIVRSTQAKMISEKEAMLNVLTSLTSQINQTVGTAWISPSATEFQQGYEQLRTQIVQQMDALGQMAQALQNEINQWVEHARTMG